MKIKHLLGMAAVALMAAACSNDLNDVLAPEAPQKGIPFVATIAPKTFDATTRALTVATDDDGKNYLKAAWTVGEEIMLTYIANDEMIQTIASVDAVSSEDGSATIKANLVGGVADGANVTLVYPASSATPSGSYGLPPTVNYGYVINDLDIRYATSTINVKDEVATLVGGISLNPQYAIVRFIIKNLAGDEVAMKKLVIKRGDTSVYPYEVKNDVAEVNFYVALPYINDEELWFEALDSSDNPYIAKGTANLKVGTFYETDLKMATLGDLMNSDGSFSATAEEGKTPIGVIAHLGNDATVESTADGGGHGLVLALKNADSNVKWSTDTETWQFGEEAKVADTDALLRSTNVSGYTNTKTLVEKTDAGDPEDLFPAAYYAWNYSEKNSSDKAPTGTTGWFLPSAQQWVKIMTGLGGLNTVKWDNFFDGNTAINNWETALKKAGSDNYDTFNTSSNLANYWSSSENNKSGAVVVIIDTEYSSFMFRNQTKSYIVGSEMFVRPVLAF